jgi:hypothetical protein
MVPHATVTKLPALGLTLVSCIEPQSGALAASRDQLPQPAIAAPALPAPSVAGLTFVGWQQPIACGGVAVFPDDVVVADEDGAALIPAALLETVVADACEQERLEGWIMNEVAKGAPLPGLYPMDSATRARYEWKLASPADRLRKVESAAD